MASLSQLRIFAGISNADMQSIIPKLQPFSIAKDEVLFYHGDKGSTLYIIETGEVDVYANASGDEDILLSTVGSGAVIGEMSLIAPANRSATVKATLPTSGWSLSCDAFDLLCRQQSPGALQILKNLALMLCERLRSMPLYAGSAARSTQPAWCFHGEAYTPDPQYNDFLQRLSFFKLFQPAEIATIMSHMKQWSIPRGQVLFEDGAPGKSAYLILRGGIEESVIQSGNKQQLAILGPGKIFGLLSLLDHENRYSTCTARERCLLLEMPGQAFHTLFHKADKVAFRFLQAIVLTLIEALRRASQKYRTQVIITDLLSH